MNVLVPSVPARLKITQTMVEDFLIDPVLGVQVIFGMSLDVFQRVRLKVCWWTPRVIDTSGVSCGKTIGAWMFTNLRALLFPGHVVGVYYPSWEIAKRTYGLYFTQIAARSPIYRAQMGKPRIVGVDGKTVGDEKAMSKGASCWVISYKAGGQILIPAPNFLQDARTSAGFRFNDLYVDEYTKVEASGSEGIDAQLVGRTTKDSWNKLHPIYSNHHLFSATAEDTMHPSYARVKAYEHQIKMGNPDFAIISFNFKHYSDLEIPKAA